MPLLSAFAVFAVGFFLRPIGGLLLGSVADRVGRRNARGHLARVIGHAGLFPWYVAVLALFGLVVYLRLPETAHRPLD